MKKSFRPRVEELDRRITPSIVWNWPQPAPVASGTPLTSATLDAVAIDTATGQPPVGMTTEYWIGGTNERIFPTATDPTTGATIPGTILPDGQYPIQAYEFNADGSFDPNYIQDTVTVGDQVQPPGPAQTIKILWNQPAPVTAGQPLTTGTLDAQAFDSSGQPAAGTMRYWFSGTNQEVKVGDVITAPGTWRIQAYYFDMNGNTDVTNYVEVGLIVAPSQQTPNIAWNTQASMVYGTPLCASQLCAVAIDPTTGAQVAGTFTYSQQAGTCLPIGQNCITATFTPADTACYTQAKASVVINVTVPSSWVWVLSSSALNNTLVASKFAVDTGNAGTITLENGTILYGDSYNDITQGAGVTKGVIYSTTNDATGSQLSGFTYQTSITVNCVLADGSLAPLTFDLYSVS